MIETSQSVFVLYLTLKAIYNIWFHPLSKFPEPRLQAASRLPYTISVFRGNATSDTKKWHDKYGHVVRITPDTLSYSCSQAWMDIFGMRQSDKRGNLPKDPRFYFKTPEGVDTISTLCWLNFLTTDIIGESSFGRRFGGLTDGRLHPWLKTVFWTLMSFTFMRELNTWPAIKCAVFASIPQKMVEYRKAAMSFSAEAAKGRMEMGTNRPVFMSYILKHNDDGGRCAEIEAAAITFIVAGSETMATILSGTMYLLCMNPSVMQSLTCEILTHFPKESDLVLVKLQQHECLNALLQEGLRLYPPAPDNLFRETPAGGSIVTGKWTQNFHRPTKFIPERWMKGAPLEFERDGKKTLKPFSVGPRGCLGKSFAWAEMRIILANMVWHLDFELQPDSRDWISKQRVFFLWEKWDPNVRISSR
ncbi:cytochrome protein [Zopfia rhizophila CBS 207.26]|uniref:Cytochrome protein n=1 Tax=Zopfia rhizophila CBS 207.26 TaxID=1314779 RepID=A0A6A6E2J7_9PEZI|nr:cytochrome protein [Zopfia rhizophila CBS 207.26]